MGTCTSSVDTTQAQIDKLTEDVLTLKRHIDHLYNLYKYQNKQLDGEKIHVF